MIEIDTEHIVLYQWLWGFRRSPNWGLLYLYTHRNISNTYWDMYKELLQSNKTESLRKNCPPKMDKMLEQIAKWQINIWKVLKPHWLSHLNHRVIDTTTHPPKWLNFKNLFRLTRQSVDKDVEQMELWDTTGRRVNEHEHFGKLFSSIYQHIPTLQPSNSVSKYISNRNADTNKIVIAALFIRTPNWEQPKCPSTE